MNYKIKAIKISIGECDLCGTCVGVCPADAIELKESSIIIIQSKCTKCQNCVWICPLSAIKIIEEKKNEK
ncbi:MAG: 4Fe-4S binding protein [Ignavibacteriales bacterium]|nr:4Fe-4S binding protein [Ignavibacteriales bacterium]